MEVNVKAEYLDFESWEDVLKWQKELLEMPAYEARKRLLSSVAKESTWYQLLFRHSQQNYESALENGSMSFASATDFEYVSLSEYQDYLEELSKYSRLSITFPLLPTISYKQKEFMDKVRTITGYEDIDKLFDNHIKLQTVLEPSNDLYAAIEDFIKIDAFHKMPYIEFDENGKALEPEELEGDELRCQLRAQYERILEIANLIYQEDYPEEIVERLRMIMDEVGQCLDEMDRDNCVYEMGQIGERLYNIKDDFDKSKHKESYVIDRDEQKEENTKKQKEEFEQQRQLERDRKDSEELPKLISECQTKIEDYEKKIGDFKAQIESMTDYSAISEMYKQMGELSRDIGLEKNTLSRYKERYETLNAQFNHTRPTNDELEASYGNERIADGVMNATEIKIEPERKSGIIKE